MSHLYFAVNHLLHSDKKDPLNINIRIVEYARSVGVDCDTVLNEMKSQLVSSGWKQHPSFEHRHIKYVATHPKVLMVYVIDLIDMRYAAYCCVVKGVNHEKECFDYWRDGIKLTQQQAEAFLSVPLFTWRD